MPKVSIVLPSYNGEKYIRKSIESVLAQTFQDWELIIVNDCSIDSTPEIAEEYAQKDSRIRVIHNQVNQKLPNSLNIGFEASKGEYLTWTSDDNLYLPCAIERMVNFLEENPYEYFVCAAMNFISENDEYIGTAKKYNNELMLILECVGACFLYRRCVLYSVGGYDPSFFLVEDYEYWLRILFHYGNIAFIDEVLYQYRQHSKSLTATRYNEVRYKDTELKWHYCDEILKRLQDKKDLICMLYYRIRVYYSADQKIKEKFLEYVPELIIDSGDEINEKVIVYGAGQIGRKFAEKYDNYIYCFADRNKSLEGSYIGNKVIISLNDLIKYKGEYKIVVAAGTEKIYDFICTLTEMGVTECIVYTE